MWLNKNEEKTFGPFLVYVHEHENDIFIFSYNDGTELEVTLYLYEYESDNGLDIHDKEYEEYWELAFEITKVIKDDRNLYSIKDKVLVNYHTIPMKYNVASVGN